MIKDFIDKVREYPHREHSFDLPKFTGGVWRLETATVQNTPCIVLHITVTLTNQEFETYCPVAEFEYTKFLEMLTKAYHWSRYLRPSRTCEELQMLISAAIAAPEEESPFIMALRELRDYPTKENIDNLIRIAIEEGFIE